MSKKQLEACNTLHRESWINRPKIESYTNHHWVHVVMHEEDWKEKPSVHIKKIVPNLKNVNKVITGLKNRVNITKVLGLQRHQIRYNSQKL